MNTELLELKKALALVERSEQIDSKIVSSIAGYSTPIYQLLSAYNRRLQSRSEGFIKFVHRLVARLRSEISQFDHTPETKNEVRIAVSAPASLSQKRIAANRANSLKSCGPRTGRGKAWSARNALLHGLRSERLMLTGERLLEYERWSQIFRAGMDPRDEIKDQLVSSMSVAAWKLHTCLTLESTLLSSSAAQKKLSTLFKYEATLNSRLLGLCFEFKQYAIHIHKEVRNMPSKEWDLLRDGILWKSFTKVLDEEALGQTKELIGHLQEAHDRRDWKEFVLCDWLAAALIKLRILNGAEAAHMQVAAKSNEECVRKAPAEMQEAARAVSLLPSYDVLEPIMKYGGYTQRQIYKMLDSLERFTAETDEANDTSGKAHKPAHGIKQDNNQEDKTSSA